MKKLIKLTLCCSDNTEKQKKQNLEKQKILLQKRQQYPEIWIPECSPLKERLNKNNHSTSKQNKNPLFKGFFRMRDRFSNIKPVEIHFFDNQISIYNLDEITDQNQHKPSRVFQMKRNLRFQKVNLTHLQQLDIWPEIHDDSGKINEEGIEIDLFMNEKNIIRYYIYTEEFKTHNLANYYFTYRLFKNNFKEDYKIVKNVGQGANARVYLVQKRQTKEFFAVKIFDKAKMQNYDVQFNSIMYEIKLMAKLQHQNILQLFEIYEDQSRLYLVIDIYYGGTLYQYYKKHHPLSQTQITTIMIQLLDALSYMHNHDVMHRDLKPDNILIKEKLSIDKIAIADFGLSTEIKLQSFIHSRVGTPGYIAPEIFKCNKQVLYSEQCDMFSLGIIFHTLLLGFNPFTRKKKDSQEIFKSNESCIINFKDKIYSTLPAITLDLLKQLLKMDPEERITADNALKHRFFAFNSPRKASSIQNTDIKSSKWSEKIMTEDEHKNLKYNNLQIDTQQTNSIYNNTTTITNQNNTHLPLKNEPSHIKITPTKNQQHDIKMFKDISHYTEKTEKSEILNTARSINNNINTENSKNSKQQINANTIKRQPRLSNGNNRVYQQLNTQNSLFVTRTPKNKAPYLETHQRLDSNQSLQLSMAMPFTNNNNLDEYYKDYPDKQLLNQSQFSQQNQLLQSQQQQPQLNSNRSNDKKHGTFHMPQNISQFQKSSNIQPSPVNRSEEPSPIIQKHQRNFSVNHKKRNSSFKQTLMLRKQQTFNLDQRNESIDTQNITNITQQREEIKRKNSQLNQIYPINTSIIQQDLSISNTLYQTIPNSEINNNK